MDESLSVNTKSDWIRYGLGMVYMKKKRYKLAEDKFNDILAINSSYADVYAQLGVAKSMQNKHEEANALLKKAIGLVAFDTAKDDFEFRNNNDLLIKTPPSLKTRNNKNENIEVQKKMWNGYWLETTNDAKIKISGIQAMNNTIIIKNMYINDNNIIQWEAKLKPTLDGSFEGIAKHHYYLKKKGWDDFKLILNPLEENVLGGLCINMNDIIKKFPIQFEKEN